MVPCKDLNKLRTTTSTVSTPLGRLRICLKIGYSLVTWRWQMDCCCDARHCKTLQDIARHCKTLQDPARNTGSSDPARKIRKWSIWALRKHEIHIFDLHPSATNWKSVAILIGDWHGLMVWQSCLICVATLRILWNRVLSGELRQLSSPLPMFRGRGRNTKWSGHSSGWSIGGRRPRLEGQAWV